MTRSLRSERGSALVPALVIVGLLLMSGSAMLATIDTQQRESRRERVRESNFTLVEGILNTQIFRLSKRWPGETSDTAPYPVGCPAAVATVDCPSTTTLKGIFNNVDHGSWDTVRWTTQVRDDDNGGTPSNGSYWSDTMLTTAPAYDRNGNDRLWVRAQATVRGRTRAVVALVKAEVVESRLVPNETIVAGWFQTTNEGVQKDFIDQQAGGSIIVRCGAGGEATLPPNQTADCADFKETRHGSTVSPPRVYSRPGYGNAYEDPELSIDALREQASMQGNYFASGCPTSLAGDVAGEIVFVEKAPAAGCPFQSNAIYNSPDRPGAVVVASGGMLELRGTLQFYGLLYHANMQETVDGLTGPKQVLLKLHGNAKVVGGMVIDGYRGGVEVGSSGQGQLVHSPNAGGALKTFGTAGIVQNSFRELRVAVAPAQ